MELKDRIALIIEENNFKQKELAAIMGVTESYVSILLAGKRSTNLSTSVASLIEEKLGYSAEWLLTGKEPKLKRVGNTQNISDVHKRAIIQLEKMSDEQVKAVLAFINSLDEIEAVLRDEN